MQARLGNLDLNRNLPEYTRRPFLSGPVVQPGLEMSPERTSALHAETLRGRMVGSSNLPRPTIHLSPKRSNVPEESLKGDCALAGSK